MAENNKYRSESKAVGNGSEEARFKEYNMTSYPSQYDLRETNQNMEGFISMGDPNIPEGKLPDINYAEHINALSDAVMVIQQVLGLNPHLSTKQIENNFTTIDERIEYIENMEGYYDKRYGGENTGGVWKPSYGQTILTHTHKGGNESAAKIDLINEVSGLLSKNNIDVSQKTGLTGENLSVSTKINTKISDSLDDKLSVSTGGTVKGKLQVTASLESRVSKDYSAEDPELKGTLVTDVSSSFGKSKYVTGTEAQWLLNHRFDNLLAGKYVLGVRVKTSALITSNLVNFIFRDTGVQKATINIKGNEFDKANKYKMFYFVFEYDPVALNSYPTILFRKVGTTDSVKVTIDSAFITPVHPGIFDK